MMRCQRLLQMLVVLCAVGAVRAEQPDAAQLAQERRQAELDAPKLVEVLELKPGMTVADVGSGFGAMTVVLGHWNKGRSEEHTSELQSQSNLVCRLLLEKKNTS